MLDIKTEVCFPMKEYEVERPDRVGESHGGVFIVTKRDLLLDREYELETEYEIVWCNLNMTGSKTLHIGAYYKPHEKDKKSLEELEMSLSHIGNNNESILLAGDFNFASWNWKDRILKSNCSYLALHYRFRDLLDDRGLAQLIEEPTRDKNTLDLIITSTP